MITKVARVTRSQPNQSLEQFELEPLGGSGNDFDEIKNIINVSTNPGPDNSYSVTVHSGDFTGITNINVPSWVYVIVLPGAFFDEDAFIGNPENVANLNTISSEDDENGGSGSGSVGGISSSPTFENVTVCNRILVAGEGPNETTSEFKKDVDIDGTLTAGSVVETSSFTKKNNICAIEDDQTDNILMLEPVRFNWKESNEHDIGLIAEQVEHVYPEFVERDKNGYVVGIKYSKLVAVLIKSIQELNTRINRLENNDTI